MKNSINISNNVNLILNTYRYIYIYIYIYFQNATENLLFSTASTMPSKTSQQGSVEMERFWNLQRSKFVNNNGAKMVDKLTEANEVG